MCYISDHAVLRFLERVKGLDIEAIRAEMQSPALETAAILGCDTVILGCGARIKLQGDVAVTVLPKRGR